MTRRCARRARTAVSAAASTRGARPRTASYEIRGDPEHPANFGRVCSKGAALGDTLGLDGRLLHPEIRGARASWDEALDAVAGGFARTIAAHGPDSVAFYVSGQLLTEDYYVANKLMKGFIGSANIDTNSRLCMASAVAGYKRAFGADTVPNDYTDLEQAELDRARRLESRVVPSGAVPARDRAAKAANPKLRVVRDRSAAHADRDIADLFLQLRPGTDVLLFNGLLNYLAPRGCARSRVPRRAHRRLRRRDARREGDARRRFPPSQRRAGSPRTTCSSSTAGSRARRGPSRRSRRA